MSLSQTLTSRRYADLLQRALDGDPDALGHRLLADDDPGIALSPPISIARWLVERWLAEYGGAA